MKYSDLRNGMIVIVDSGFTCMPAGEKMVEGSEDDFFISCSRGQHFLSGQIGDDDELIGISQKEDCTP